MINYILFFGALAVILGFIIYQIAKKKFKLDNSTYNGGTVPPVVEPPVVEPPVTAIEFDKPKLIISAEGGNSVGSFEVQVNFTPANLHTETSLIFEDGVAWCWIEEGTTDSNEYGWFKLRVSASENQGKKRKCIARVHDISNSVADADLSIEQLAYSKK